MHTKALSTLSDKAIKLYYNYTYIDVFNFIEQGYKVI